MKRTCTSQYLQAVDSYSALIPKVVDKLKRTLCLSSKQQSIFAIVLPLVNLMDNQVACFSNKGNSISLFSQQGGPAESSKRFDAVSRV